MLQATKQAEQSLPARRVTVVVQPLHPPGSQYQQRLQWQLHISQCMPGCS